MVKSHYLRENKSEWSPRHVAFLDTETTPVREGKRETQALRMWVYGCVDRRNRQPGGKPVVTSSGALPGDLARAIDTSIVGRDNLWIFAHNLGFDLVTTRLVDHLRPLGWHLVDLHFAGRNVRAQLSRGKKTIWLVDSWSWLTTSLDNIGQAIGRPKLPMPAWDASEDEWRTYCVNDVLVLSEAVLTVLRWWDDNHLGHWGRSGPSTGWASMRHLSAKNAIVIHTGEGVREADRLAIYGGRRDVTYVGALDSGPFAVLDFENAYLTVAANCMLPTMRLFHQDSWSLDQPRWWHQQYGLVAECEVETDVPRYPLRTDRGVSYPVGRFRTVLCSPEIYRAQELGDLVNVGQGYLHKVGYPLGRWAGWALEQIDPRNRKVPPVVQIMVKQWGRSVPGKFAGRFSRTVDWGPSLYPDWHIERGTYGPDHLPTHEVHAAGRHWLSIGDQESDNAYPAVLAWIESYVRVALGRMLEALGEDVWVLADTDGCIVDLSRAPEWLAGRTGRRPGTKDPTRLAERLCGHLGALTWPLTPRVKTIAQTLSVAGPQHFVADDYVKAAGMPRIEVDRETGEHRHMVWPGLAWQMSNGSPDGYVRVEHTWTSPTVTARRWVLKDGRCVPVHAEIDDDGRPAIRPWVCGDYWQELDHLADEQGPALAGLY